MRNLSILTVLAATMVAAGCASNPSQAPAAPAAQAAPAATPAQVAAATDAAADDPDRKICKVTQVTGTRIQKAKVCLTAREWNDLAEASQRAMRDVERSNSAGVGGETLPTDGGGGG